MDISFDSNIFREIDEMTNYEIHVKNLIRSQELSSRKEKEWTTGEIENIVNYLHNPTKVGIWSLKAKWNPENSIIKYIESEINEYISKNEKLTIIFGKREIELDLKNPEILKQIKENLKRFSFILRLFTYFHKLKLSKDEQSSEFLRSDFDQDDILIFEMLDMEKIEEKYKDAYNLFKDDLYCDEMVPKIVSNVIFKFNKGHIILTYLSESISIISINHDSIKIVNDFLGYLNLIEEIRIEAYFSPEEVVFDQYITYLKSVRSKIIEYPVFNRLLADGISEFFKDNFSGCIGTIGIMAEDLFTQIYETLYREEAPKSLSMGQMYDQIQREIQKRLSAERIDPMIEGNILFKETNKILDKIKSQDMNVQKETLELIRKVLQNIKEQNEFTRDLIKKKTSTDGAISLFPKKIQSNLNELIKYRNAISHKSRIPIGKYEATRTVFCVMTLLLWWNNERKLIDWEESEEGIIMKIVERNKSI